MREIPSCGRVKAKTKFGGFTKRRKSFIWLTACASQLETLLRSQNLPPMRRTKKVTPIQISVSSEELGVAELVGSSWCAWVATCVDDGWHWWATTIPVEIKEMSSTMALAALATPCFDVNMRKD
jgi:hypothetical protein